MSLDNVASLAAILTPLLLLFFGQRFQRASKREEYWREREDQLRDDRIAIYDEILLPFVMILSKGALPDEKRFRGVKKEDAPIMLITSAEYRKASFKLMLMSSDSVARAYNELMQYFYSLNKRSASDDSKAEASLELWQYLGRFLLEIRRNITSQETQLTKIDMLEWMITDARELFPIEDRSQ